MAEQNTQNSQQQESALCRLADGFCDGLGPLSWESLFGITDRKFVKQAERRTSRDIPYGIGASTGILTAYGVPIGTLFGLAYYFL